MNKRARGQAIVEVALMLPLGVFAAGGLIDVGRLQDARSTIDFGAREGLAPAITSPCNHVKGNPGNDCAAGLAVGQYPSGDSVCSIMAANVRHDVICGDGANQPDIPATADPGSVYVQVDSLAQCNATATATSRDTPRLSGLGAEPSIRVTVVEFWQALTPGFPSPIRMVATACGLQTW